MNKRPENYEPNKGLDKKANIPYAIESLANWVIDGIISHKTNMIKDFEPAWKITIEKITEIRAIEISDGIESFNLPLVDGHLSSQALAKIIVDNLVDAQLINRTYFDLAFTIAAEEIDVIKAMGVYKVIFPSFTT